MRAHLGDGGLIVAATHGPIGIDGMRGIAARTGGMNALAALFLRDMRIAVRVGGGA